MCSIAPSINQYDLNPQPSEIGQALALMGGLSVFLKLSLTWYLRPSPNSRYSVSQKLTKLFTQTMSTWPITFAGFVILGLISRGNTNGSLDTLVWIVLSVILFLSRIGCIPFTYDASSIGLDAHYTDSCCVV